MTSQPVCAPAYVGRPHKLFAAAMPLDSPGGYTSPGPIDTPAARSPGYSSWVRGVSSFQKTKMAGQTPPPFPLDSIYEYGEKTGS